MANLVSGVAVAIVVAFLGVVVARRYTARWETAQARRERDLATAGELYPVYGEFFATMKVWNAHLRGTDPPPPPVELVRLGPLDDSRKSELLGAAAALALTYS